MQAAERFAKHHITQESRGDRVHATESPCGAHMSPCQHSTHLQHVEGTGREATQQDPFHVPTLQVIAIPIEHEEGVTQRDEE